MEVMCRARTLLYGGVAANPRSHLRLVYEANPLSFIAEQVISHILALCAILTAPYVRCHSFKAMLYSTETFVAKNAHRFLLYSQTLLHPESLPRPAAEAAVEALLCSSCMAVAERLLKG